MTAGRLELFLWGQLDFREQADFLSQCDLKQLENESVFEALFYSMSWGLQTGASELEKESDWAQFVAPMPVKMAGSTSPLFTESEWDRLISRAFDVVALPKREGKFIRFPKIVRYLAAACFIGVVAGGIVWKQFRVPQRAVPHTVVIAHEESAHENIRRSALVFDTLVIYSTPARARKLISADRGEGIVQLGDKTAILLEKDAAVAVTAQNDTAVAVRISRGSALFTVEKNRYRSFAVATPVCNIAVTGTIFRLAIENDTTIVSVLEGTVLAIKKAGSAGVSVHAGMSARIRPDTVMVDYGDMAASMLHRSNILRDYLMENGVWENGRFVRSGSIPNTDSLP